MPRIERRIEGGDQPAGVRLIGVFRSGGDGVVPIDVAAILDAVEHQILPRPDRARIERDVEADGDLLEGLVEDRAAGRPGGQRPKGIGGCLFRGQRGRWGWFEGQHREDEPAFQHLTARLAAAPVEAWTSEVPLHRGELHGGIGAGVAGREFGSQLCAGSLGRTLSRVSERVAKTQLWARVVQARYPRSASACVGLLRFP